MCLNCPPEDQSQPQITLIVAPVALLHQWEDEITAHCKKNTFNGVYVHHGANKLKSLRDLRQYEVIICTYQAIMRSYPQRPKKRKEMTRDAYDKYWSEAWERRGIFHRVKFWRVILDESHIIKNRRSQTSIACTELDAVHTWCLSGTPIQNALEDVYPVLRFIQHPTVSAYENFQAFLGATSDATLKAERVKAVLKNYIMRRTKKDYLMGELLITLPKKRIRIVELELGGEELALYKAVEARAREKINKFIGKGTILKEWNNILVMLLRLRQLCCHPYLILQAINENFTADDLEAALSSGDQGGHAGEGGVDIEIDASLESSTLRKILTAARHKIYSSIPPCTICFDQPTAPVLANCHHPFCRDCINGLLADNLATGAVTHCPDCGETISEFSLTSPSGADVDVDPDSTSTLPEDLKFIHSTKTQFLTNQLLAWHAQHPGEKIVVFSQFTSFLNLIARGLDVAGGGGLHYVRYQGDMDMHARQDALDTFRNDPHVPVMLTSIRAGGVGLNLTCASLVVCCDLWWNEAVEMQAVERVHRLGQTKEVEVARMWVRGGVEERIMALQREKGTMAGFVLGEQVSGAGVRGGLGKREVLRLFGIGNGGTTSVGGV
jgi:SNF2 family DNA or RNA helicase